MKSLAVIGTIAMFLVGGGIVVHSIPKSHIMFHRQTESVANVLVAPSIISGALNSIVGLVAGALVLAGVSLIKGILGKVKR